MIPNAWVAIVMTLATYRVVRLIGWDEFPWVKKLRDKATGEEVYYNAAVNRDNAILRHKHPTLHHFLNCPFCQGFWWSLIIYAAWVAVGSPGSITAESWLFYPLAPFALSAAVGLLTKNLDA